MAQSSSSDPVFGFCVPSGLWNMELDQQRELVGRVADLGFEHLYTADHVSFRDGSGNDGFVEVAALSALHPSIGVMISIYLLPLRHPLPVARQLATMHKIAPNRMLFGVGIGGDDRHEVEVCGVDPSTRGRQTNESLQVIRALMAGETLDFAGEFFQLEKARIKPTIDPAIPILVGGRSDAALARTAAFGDGWIGVWCSPKRYAQAIASISQLAADAGREGVHWQHGYQPWVGVADTKAEARALVAAAMESFYKLPFEQFERYIPFGTPADVAAELKPYMDAGCHIMNLKVVAGSSDDEISGGGEVRQLLL